MDKSPNRLFLRFVQKYHITAVRKHKKNQIAMCLLRGYQSCDDVSSSFIAQESDKGLALTI